MQYWLMKSEPESYSIDDLKRDRRACWDGVRNYQARNFMRDQMKVGDLVLFHHSGGDSPGVAGIAKVSRTAYPDHTALDKKDQHFDPKSTKDNPIWMMVDIEFVERFDNIISLKTLKSDKRLAGMALLQRGQRLSVQPVTAEQFKIVRELATRG